MQRRRALEERGKQPKFVGHAPGEYRNFATEAIAVGPNPCRLCDANFATQADFARHIQVRHGGMIAYRGRLWYEATGEGKPVRSVGAQVWRLTTATAAEELVSGSSSWPVCEEPDVENLSAARRTALLGIEGAVSSFGGLLAFYQTIVFDSQRLLGSSWSSRAPEELAQALLEGQDSLYRAALISCSRKRTVDQPEDEHVRVFVLMCGRSQHLPVDRFWWDDAYLVEDLFLFRGLGDFQDPRLHRQSRELLGPILQDVHQKRGGFSGMLRELRSRLNPSCGSPAEVLSHLSASNDDLYMSITTNGKDLPALSQLQGVLPFLMSNPPEYVYYHSGAAMAAFFPPHEIAT